MEDTIQRMTREAMERAGSHKLDLRIVTNAGTNQPDPEIVMDPMIETVPIVKISWKDKDGVIHELH